ncbi:MAG: MBL fold metallo-hydrolase [Methanoregulaceae archaeon]|nr:MBL fold metallo-hydrolase [Methanoregulaceae archaeon]
MNARHKLGVASVVGLVAAGAFWSTRPSPNDGTRVSFLSVGQGDCTVVRSGGKTVLIDAGPATDRYDAGARIIVPKLRQMGVTQIDMVLLTHPDSDHIGGLSSITRRISVQAIGVPLHYKGHPELSREFKEAGIRDDQVQWIAGPSVAKFGDATLRMDVPAWDPTTSDNEGSLFVWIGMGASSLMMTGDAGEIAELQMIKKGPWTAQYLKLGHHGSRFSSNGGWLEHVRPQFAIASSGKNNSYGHPAPDTLERCRVRGIVVWRTDQHGDLHLKATAKGFVRTR